MKTLPAFIQRRGVQNERRVLFFSYLCLLANVIQQLCLRLQDAVPDKSEIRAECR
jgi:hypothetical protein